MHERECKCKFLMIIVDVNIQLLTSFVFVLLEGKIYNPADIAIVNKFNGVEENDIPNGLSVSPSVLGLP